MTQKKIQVVERNRDIAELITDILTEVGYVAIVTESEALLKSGVPAADLLLIDIEPHTMMGAFLHSFKIDTATRTIPIIGLSTLKETDAQALGLYADAFVRKPFDIQNLVAVVYACIGASSIEHEGEMDLIAAIGE